MTKTYFYCVFGLCLWFLVPKTFEGFYKGIKVSCVVIIKWGWKCLRYMRMGAGCQENQSCVRERKSQSCSLASGEGRAVEGWIDLVNNLVTNQWLSQSWLYNEISIKPQRFGELLGWWMLGDAGTTGAWRGHGSSSSFPQTSSTVSPHLAVDSNKYFPQFCKTL